MKKLITGILCFVLILSLTGCGVKEHLEEKAGEAIAEKTLEETGGGDVDIDGDKVTLKDENGDELTIGSTEWPKSELAKSIPEFTEGEITGVYDGEDSVMITLETVEESDANAYLDTIKKEFTQEPVELNTEGSFNYGAKNADGIGVTLLYSEGTLTISVTKAVE